MSTNKRLEEIRAARLKKRADLIKAGNNPYPSEVRRTHTVADVLTSFQSLENSKKAVMLLGRLRGVRSHGGVIFFDLHDQSGGIQLQARKDDMLENEFTQAASLEVGDWVQATGVATRTQRGVETVDLTEVTIISKAIRPLPDSWYGLKDHESRFRQRELDFLLNEDALDTLVMKSQIITWLRKYLTDQGYVEVETPVLQSVPGGATARPFATHHNALDIPLYLRVSAELYLKRLLVGGLEKVFEIERRFRNEGIDKQHNPEFTMLESQWAYADYEDLMDFTEDTLEKLCQEVYGSTDVDWQDYVLSFEKPFDRVRYVDLVSDRIGFDILKEKDLEKYRAQFTKEGIDAPETENYYHFVDEFYKEIIRPTIIQPTLLYDFPAEMAPLAKRSVTDPRIAERMQLIAAGMELNTCYTELNDPVVQRELFEQQEQDRAAGDDEAQRIDEAYLTAMEYGMPPNAGWSLGIDRFAALLTNSPTLRDTIAFPLLKPKE